MSAPWLDDEPIPPWRPPREPPQAFKASQIMPSMEDIDGEQLQMKTQARPEWAQPLFQMNDAVEVLVGTRPGAIPQSCEEVWQQATVLQCTPATKAHSKSGSASSATYVLLSKGKHMRHIPAASVRRITPRAKNTTSGTLISSTARLTVTEIPTGKTQRIASPGMSPAATAQDLQSQLQIHSVQVPEIVQAGKQATFFFSVSADQQPQSASGKKVTATCGDANLTVQVVDPAAGAFKAAFSPTVAGQQLFEIIVAHRMAAAGKGVSHSETIDVAAGAVAHCALEGLEEQFEAVESVRFLLTLSDKFGNLCDINSCNVRLWYGLSGQLSADGVAREGMVGSGSECEPLQVQLQKGPEQIMGCFNASRTGEYILEAWAKRTAAAVQRVHMRVRAGQTDPRKCIVHPEDIPKLVSGARLNQEIQLRVLTYDKLGNRRESGDGDAHASCTLDDAVPGSTTAVFEGVNRNDGSYVLKCVPQQAGNGFVFVRFDGDLIADQPMHCTFGDVVEYQSTSMSDTTFLTTTF